MHIPVLLKEVITYLAPSKGKVYLDVTFGAGGHTRAILESEPTCRVVALDWDQNTLETYGAPLQEAFPGRLTLLWGNFAHLQRIAKKEQLDPFDGILADFGLSTMQIRQNAGISFLEDSPLDMRMSPAHQRITAKHVVNEATEEELRAILWEFAEERYAKQIARTIVAERKKKPLLMTMQLVMLIEKIVPKVGPIHPATKTFQGLRIYINKELDNIAAFLPAALNLLNVGGRLACISFHSLEDRIVKQFFNDCAHAGKMDIITKRAVQASIEERAINRSARSAKLRVAQKNC